MKALVFSDSHGLSAGMARMIQRETPDTVLHLGDFIADMQGLRARFPEVRFIGVAGNCDFFLGEPADRCFELEGVRIFMTHGHGYQVKQGLDSVAAAAGSRGAGLLLFGHTHRPVYEIKAGLHILNPGSVSGVHTARKTYGIIEFSENGFSCRIASAE